MDTGTYYEPYIEPYVEVTATWGEETEGSQTIKGKTKEQVLNEARMRINRFILWDEEPKAKGMEYPKGPDLSGGYW